MSETRRSALHEVLRECEDYVNVEVFDDACTHALNSLLQPWSLYLKHDVKLLLEWVIPFPALL